LHLIAEETPQAQSVQKDLLPKKREYIAEINDFYKTFFNNLLRKKALG
jgi:hypothetical protein